MLHCSWEKDAAFALLFPCMQKTLLLVIREHCMEILRLLPITTRAFHPVSPAKKCAAKEAIKPTSLDLCAPAVFSSAAGWIYWLTAFESQKWARPWSCRQLVLVPPATAGASAEGHSSCPPACWCGQWPHESSDSQMLHPHLGNTLEMPF